MILNPFARGVARRAVLAASLVFCVMLSLKGQEAQKAAATKTKEAAAEEGARKKASNAKAEAEGKAAKAKAGEKAAEEKKAEKKTAPANPLGNLIRGIFGGRRNVPNVKTIPQDPNDKSRGNGDELVRDHIDARAPYDPRQEKRLRRVEALVREKDWDRALEAIQLLLDQPENSLYRVKLGQMVPIRDEANRILGTLPAEQRNRYRTINGGLADALLREARHSGDLAQFVEVSARYFHTPAGQHATNYLGSMHFDRGEFALAARCFGQMLAAKADVTQEPAWRFKAALAFAKSDRPKESRKLIEQLTSESRGHQLGAEPIDAEEWIATASSTNLAPAAARTDWPMFKGAPHHRATSHGGVPLLLSRWRQPLSQSHRVREQIEFLLQDLTDLNRAVVPAFFPLVADGKVIYRSFRGVRVVDAENGNLLWETDGGLSADRLLSGDTAQQVSGQVVWNIGVNGSNTSYRGSGADNHALTGLLFRDGTYGILNSDEQRVFVIEDHAILSRYQPGYRRGFSSSSRDTYQRDWGTNKIVAYGLADGRPSWEIGGPARGEAFDLPLAGNYFFGPPTPDNGELFAVGEKENELRLFCLDPASGRPKWSQLIAYSDVKIEQDFGRRWWSAQVAVSDGVILCPTTVGWLVAVDRVDRSILWAHRYSRPNRSRTSRNPGTTSVVHSTSLNGRWAPSAPVISGNFVVFTPPEYTQNEAPIVDCLNLHDGTRRWKKDKEANVYLAGVQDNRVLLVGTTAVSAVALDTGVSIWTTPLSSTGEARPSGQGVVGGEEFYLPLQSGELWRVNLESGKVAAKHFLPEGSSPLGNLAMNEGTLVSLSPLGVSSFEQRDLIREQIRVRKENDPHDAWALIREAEIHQLNHDFAAALVLLEQVRPEGLDASLQPRYRTGMVASLATVIREDLGANGPALEKLSAFVKTDSERMRYRQLAVQFEVAQGRFENAFDIYRQLAFESPELMVPRDENDRVLVRLDAWTAGKLVDLWAALPADVRTHLDQRLSALAEAAGKGSQSEQEQFIALFGFHRAAEPVRFRLAERYVEGRDLFRAEKLLVKLGQSQTPEIAADAKERLARLLLSFNVPMDAAEVYRALHRDHAEVELPSGKRVAELIAELRSKDTVPLDHRHTPVSWGESDLKLVRNSGSSSAQYRSVESALTDASFFRQHRMQYAQTGQRLTISEAASGDLHWSIGLRAAANARSDAIVSLQDGHQMLLLHRDVLHCLSPVEKRVVWTRPLANRQQATSYYRQTSRQNAPAMQLLSNLTSSSGLMQFNRQHGMLAFGDADYVCHYGRREFIVRDADTGRIRWRRERVPTGTTFVGTRERLYVIHPNQGGAEAVRTSDGRIIEIPELATLLRSAIAVAGEDLIVLQTGTRSLLGLGSPKTTLRRYDPVSKQEQWKVEVVGNSYASRIGKQLLAILKSNGELQTIDLETGVVKTIGTLPVADLRSKTNVYAVADHDNFYVVVNKRRFSTYSESLPSLRVNGLVFGLDRTGGRPLWRQEVKEQNLLLPMLQSSPVLLFASRKYTRVGKSYRWASSLLALDKQTGGRLVDSDGYSTSNFTNLRINMIDRYIELRSYNQRLRLVATAPEKKPEVEDKEGKKP